MAEEQSPPNPSGTVVSASSGTTPPTVNPSGTVAPPATSLTPEQQEIALRQSRAENAEMRTKLTAFEKAQAAAEAAKLSEVEKAAKRADEAEAKVKEYQEKLMATQVKLAAQSMHFANPDLAARLVTVDPDASETDILKALQALATNDPYLIKAPDATPPAAAPRQAPSNPPRGATNPVAPAPFDPRNPPSLQSIWNKPKQ